ncbi:DNA-binding response regulator [Alteromonas sediminis]|uniref:DNA-binding response regulator n=1 Tax=Alteromonas sediminis TaxID=2259342 RepID=A0A3N5XYX1_9ALTE|nr:response regulator transcription factor [Alteromonas sediminis]RPJ66427.1 DNA-binding response regulator [Alteromonas sediminis]
MTQQTVSIIIAEDQNMLRGALASLLELEDDFQIIGQARDGAEALEMSKATLPDIVVTDIEMPNMTGIELAEHLQVAGLKTKVIVLTTFARAGYLKRAMQAGVKGYLLKDASSDDLAMAIRKVFQGRKVVDPELVIDALEHIDPLSEKERKALKLASEGMSTEKIADSMFLSSGTVRNYLSNAASKLGAENRIEAARIARSKGWL